MNDNAKEQIVVRDYLLGILSDKAQMRQIEEKILLDDTFDETLSVAEDKLIEDYLDNNLSRDHRENFVRFFLSTPERKEQFRLTQNVRRYSAKAGVKRSEKIDFWSIFRPVFSSPWPVAAAIILVSLFGVTIFLHKTQERSSDTYMVTQLLNRAYKSERPFQARVSGLDYARYNITRGGKAPSVNQRELDAAEKISADAVLKGETTESLQNAGRTYLVKREFDQAITQFEKAKPPTAEILNDLGVAYLEKSKAASQNELKEKALDNFNKAGELAPGFLDARFNKALCLQQMDSPGEAKKAWEEYLKLDPTSGWANEARQNLELLSTGSP